MTELQVFIRDPKTKKPRRGAFSRISERLNVTPSTVMRWYSGEWEPGFETAEKIREMISAKIDISSCNVGRSGRKKTEQRNRKKSL